MINLTAIGSWALVDLAGEFDVVNADRIRSVAVDLVDEGATDVSVDLSRVGFMGAAGLNALLGAHQAVEAAGARMIIVGASNFARRVFTVTELDRAVPLADQPLSGDRSVWGRPSPAEGTSHLGPGHDASGRRVDPRRRLLTESTITETLQRIAGHAVHDVPGCRAASICLLARGQPRTAAVSNAVAIQIDVAQYNLNEGPCLDAARTSRTVLVDLLGDDRPFSRFAPQARRVGIQAVLSVPVITQTHTIGTLNLYSGGAFPPSAEAAATTIAHQVAASGDNSGAQQQPGGVVGAGHRHPPPSRPVQAQDRTSSPPLHPGDDLR